MHDFLLETRNISDVISRLMTVHSSLSDVALLINRAFGLPILVVTITCLLHLIITPYVLLVEANGDQEALFIAVQCLWCSLHITRMLIVVQPCYSTCTEVFCHEYTYNAFGNISADSLITHKYWPSGKGNGDQNRAAALFELGTRCTETIGNIFATITPQAIGFFSLWYVFPGQGTHYFGKYLQYSLHILIHAKNGIWIIHGNI